ncbi:GerAB/ArcD/ProY family transporter [Paenibacillus aceris]|uniref:Spore germination protein (Amino acid permease) n=1 Tax=Paenibacillus aceris TaxID=869555 RepID=A0ABS4I3S1_9BACL|nr:endospore germination permease [Paenibacillus aceris]MBP1965375.1 spore germination protein (amino acid permease) [Paenibacillus aceris]NHW36056.1 endospore germination permease [Paenibacillus aceris]
MNKSAPYEISLMQFIFLVSGVQVGIGIFQLPRTLAESAGTDGWMPILISGVLSIISGLFIIQVLKKNPDKALPSLMKHYFGRWIGSVLTAIFSVYYVFGFVAVILRMMLFVKVWLLPATPDYYLMILIAIAGYGIASGGIRSLSRYAELVFYITICLNMFFLIPVREGNLLYMLPLFKDGFQPILSGIPDCIYSYLGFEIVFILYPMLTKKQNANVGVIAANMLSMVMYLVATWVCFLFFSPDEILRFNEPTISILKTIEFKVIERFEIIFLALYLLTVFKTWVPLLWGAGFCTNELWRKITVKMFLVISLTLIVIYTFLFAHEFNQNDALQKYLSQIGFYIDYLFPIFLFGYSLLFDRFLRRYIN